MWHIVENELPDEFQFVLVFTKEGKYKISEIIKGKWLNADEVVAWIEFPTPPEGYVAKYKKFGNKERILIK